MLIMLKIEKCSSSFARHSKNCHIIGEMGKERELVKSVSGTRLQRGTEERVAVALLQEECRVRPRLGRLREQKAIKEWIEGSRGMCPGSDLFYRLEYTGTGRTHAAL